MRVTIAPQLYEWAIERSQIDKNILYTKFKKLNDWVTGNSQPTFKQLEKFAKAVYLPTAILFMPEPPKEELPIVDFRTFGKQSIRPSMPPSPHLLDTIYDCQLKQDWYINYCRLNGEAKNSFVGSFSLEADASIVAKAIREHFPLLSGQFYKDMSEAFRKRKETVEEQGILVLTSGVVKGNTHRPLDIDEFRGFVLSDEYAPLIFINGKDTDAARSFTLIHELAHIAIGESGLSNDGYDHKIEQWCNHVASEVLVPVASLQQKYNKNGDLSITIRELARFYKVSTLAILFRLKNTRLLDMPEAKFWQLYNKEKKRILDEIKNKSTTSSGGNFYNTKPTAISKRFLRALVSSAQEGQTLYRDAMNLANVKKIQTFHQLAEKVLI